MSRIQDELRSCTCKYIAKSFANSRSATLPVILNANAKLVVKIDRTERSAAGRGWMGRANHADSLFCKSRAHANPKCSIPSSCCKTSSACTSSVMWIFALRQPQAPWPARVTKLTRVRMSADTYHILNQDYQNACLLSIHKCQTESLRIEEAEKLTDLPQSI